MSKKNPNIKRKYIYSFLVFCLLFASSVLVYLQFRQVIFHQSQSLFEKDVHEISTRVDSRMQEYMSILYAGRGLFGASEFVSRDEFLLFVESQSFEERFPGIQALGFNKYVLPAEKQLFVESVRSDTSVEPLGYPEYVISPEGDRSKYYPVMYITPLEGNEAAFGFDIYSNPDRAKAVDLSIELGVPVSTAPITLVQETGEQMGFLVVLPVFKDLSLSGTQQERSQNVYGSIVAVFRAEDLLDGIVSDIAQARYMDIDVHDVESSDPTLLSHLGPQHYDKNFHYGEAIHQEVSFHVGQREWKMSFRPTAAYFDSSDIGQKIPLVAFLVSLLVSVLVSLLVFSVMQMRDKAVLLAEELTQDLKKFKLAVDNANEHVVIADPQGVIIYANDAVERITGYGRSEMVGKTPVLWGGQMDDSFYKKFWNTIKIQKKQFNGEVKNKRKNGEIYSASVHVTPVVDDDGVVLFFLGIERDISKEKEVGRIKNQLELATKSAHIGVWVYNVSNDTLVWNDEMHEIYDVKKKGFDNTLQTWLSKIHPEDAPSISKQVDDALGKKGKKFDTSFRIVRKNGSVRVVKASAVVSYDANGKPVEMVGVNFDVTKEREVDKAKTEFVSLASHQLRTPLTNIKWNLEILRDEKIKLTKKNVRTYLESTYESAGRMTGLVSALLNVSRLELGTFVVKPEDVDVSSVVAALLGEMDSVIGDKQLKVKTVFPKNLPSFFVDPQIFHIIIENLLSNAVKYTQKKGVVTFSADYKKKRGFLFVVKDTGYGIPENDQKHVFTKLFRASNIKEMDVDGTGLGLYIVKMVVESTGGKIWFESKEGKGSSFCISYPPQGMVPREGSKSLA